MRAAWMAWPSAKASEVAPRIGVEAAIRFGWDEWLRPGDGFVGMAGFGASAPAPKLYTHFGITAEKVAEKAKAALAR